VKSHYPEVAGITKNFYANRALLAVRNPIDVIVSLFNFTLTGTHDRFVDPSAYSEHQSVWSRFIKKEI